MADISIQDKYLEIAGQLPGYEPRAVQERMVCDVYHAIKTGNTLVVEAGTGAGKSFGYLIPALMSGKKPLVISTGTIALQEQLLEKDIPFIAQAAGFENLNVKLVKGRRNYLCIQKLQEFERAIHDQSSERLFVTMMKGALQQGWDGDKATLDMEIPPEIWEEVQSDSEDCLGTRCMFYSDNPYRQAREDLHKADVLIVNHALYLQDLVSGQSLLPSHDVVIFDEAHHLKSYALKAYTARIGKFATHKLLRKIDRRLQRVPEMFQHAIYQTEAEILNWLFRFERQTFKLDADPAFFALIARQIEVLTELRGWLASFDIKQLTLNTNELETDRTKVQREKLLNQLDGLTGRWEFFMSASDLDRLNWAEVKPDRLYYELKSTPLNISDQLEKTLWNEKIGILTSATLATDGKLSSIRRELGIELTPANPDVILESPFDYLNQCELYLPMGLPDPNDSRYQEAITAEIVRLLNHSQGRAFVLFTSYNALQRVSAAVIPQVTYSCRVQGDLPKNRLIEWFKNTPGSVLFATSTFWEGIDIPGEALSCVIIDKIPFPMPDEPVHSAMVDRMKRLGEDWFNAYVLPEATIRLKQGFGRLIRSRKDHGIVAILDPRLHTKGYGKKILRSLPHTRVIRSLTDASCLTLPNLDSHHQEVV